MIKNHHQKILNPSYIDLSKACVGLNFEQGEIFLIKSWNLAWYIQ